MSDKVINPLTGRLINKNGKLAKKLMKKNVVLPEQLSPEKPSCTQFHLVPNELRGYCADVSFNKIKYAVADFFCKINFQGKNFYLFGENHAHPNMCLPDRTVAFVDNIVEAVTDKFKNRKYDFFLEFELLKIGRLEKLGQRKYSFTFQLLHDKYKDCLRIQNKICPNNLRMHYVDFRTYLEFQSVSIYDVYFSEPNPTVYSQAVNMVLNLIRDKKMLKQYKNIQDQTLAMKIYNYYKTKMEDNVKFINENIYNYDSDPDVQNKVHDTIAMLMDMYAAGRIFRDFTDYSSKNIIFHGGTFHSQSLCDLLLYLNGDLKYYRLSQNSCVDLDVSKIFT